MTGVLIKEMLHEEETQTEKSNGEIVERRTWKIQGTPNTALNHKDLEDGPAAISPSHAEQELILPTP